MKLGEVTLIVPYYRNPGMLRVQLSQWLLYPDEIRVIVVDDGSPEPAEPIVRECVPQPLIGRIQLYRIGVDIPWNRGGARNLGAHVAQTEWIVHVDIDHVLRRAAADALIDASVDRSIWYRFRRFRIGRADETRRKDKIDPNADFGEIHPHVDSYLIRREFYWKVGGYDEDYSGCLGGGSPFLRQLECAAPYEILPDPICLHVYTRDAVPDANDTKLSRDTSEYSRRRREKERTGRTKAVNPLRFPWERVL
jgi:glycosyltransferase involved in cell wall biosynthesis